MDAPCGQSRAKFPSGIYGLYASAAGESSDDPATSSQGGDEQSFMPAVFVIDRDSRIVRSVAAAAFDNEVVPANVVSTLAALRRRKGRA
jgi:hypothetical protein